MGILFVQRTMDEISDGPLAVVDYALLCGLVSTCAPVHIRAIVS
jgi:hypothetical protein